MTIVPLPREFRWTLPDAWKCWVRPFTRAPGVTARGARTDVGPELGPESVGGGERPRVVPSMSTRWPLEADAPLKPIWLLTHTLPDTPAGVATPMGEAFRWSPEAEPPEPRPTLICTPPPTIVGVGEVPLPLGLAGKAAGDWCP